MLMPADANIPADEVLGEICSGGPDHAVRPVHDDLHRDDLLVIHIDRRERGRCLEYRRDGVIEAAGPRSGNRYLHAYPLDAP